MRCGRSHRQITTPILLSDAAKPPPPLLRPVSVADALSNPAPPPAFVWDGYLPRGTVSLFGAHGGTGKSTIALMLALFINAAILIVAAAAFWWLDK
mgnify:CR=1 FL=1